MNPVQLCTMYIVGTIYIIQYTSSCNVCLVKIKIPIVTSLAKRSQCPPKYNGRSSKYQLYRFGMTRIEPSIEYRSSSHNLWTLTTRTDRSIILKLILKTHFIEKINYLTRSCTYVSVFSTALLSFRIPCLSSPSLQVLWAQLRSSAYPVVPNS